MNPIVNIHIEDQELLSRMVRVTKYPDKFLRDYSDALRMKHLSGTGTHVGADVLIALALKHNLVSRSIAIDEQVVEWEKVAIGTRIAVDNAGTEVFGEYRGMVSPGTISYRPEGGDGWVEEVPRARCSIAKTAPLASPERTESVDEPSAKEAAYNTDSDVETDAVDRWSEVEPGVEVNVIVGADLVEGVYMGLSERKGCVAVEVQGVRHDVDPEDVVLKSAMEEASVEG
jgi:hypothetical protein